MESYLLLAPLLKYRAGAVRVRPKAGVETSRIPFNPRSVPGSSSEGSSDRKAHDICVSQRRRTHMILTVPWTVGQAS